MTPRVIALAPGSQIDISRRGLVLDTPAGRTTRPLMSVWGGMGLRQPGPAPSIYARQSAGRPGPTLSSPPRTSGMVVGAGDTTGTVQRMLALVPVRHHLEDQTWSHSRPWRKAPAPDPPGRCPRYPQDSQAARYLRCSRQVRSTGRSPASRSMVGSSSNEPTRYWRTPDSVGSAR